MRQCAFRTATAAVLAAALFSACRETPVPVAPDVSPRFVVQSGTSVVVNTLSDVGDGTCDETCTLREAVVAVAPGGSISFSVTGIIPLASAILVNKPMSIVGPGAGSLAVRALSDDFNKYRAFNVYNAGSVTIEALSIGGGLAGGPGGCIDVNNSNLTLRLAVVESCRAQGAGGGINASGNSVLALDRTTVRMNFADNGGGGVYVNHDATATVVASTIVNNEGREGGGLGTTGYVDITNSTISGNRARFHGGGLFAADRGAPGMQVRFSTVAYNTADSDVSGDGDGGGVLVSGNGGGTMQLFGTIIYGNIDTGGQAPDCGTAGTGGPPRTMDRSLIGSAMGCDGFVRTNTLVGADPKLLALANNGGPTLTHALGGITSAAFNAAGTPCPATDQRGVMRPQGASCDIGAYELVPPPIVVAIDIKPGSTENPLSSRAAGTVPLAILSSATFDARLVVLSTVRLGTASIATRPDGTYSVSVQDVNGDGRLDLLVLFESSALGLAANPTSLTLTATLSDGRTIIGTDAVRVVP